VLLSPFHRVAERVLGRVLSSFKSIHPQSSLIFCLDKHELVFHMST
jgi:hypothetical protein